MTEEKPLPKLPSGQLVKWKEQDYPTVYANIIGFGMSPFDIFVIFGQIGESTPSEVNAIPKVKVLLSPEQALNLQKLLGLAVDTYAANNGQLRTSGEVNVADIDNQMKALRIKPLP